MQLHHTVDPCMVCAPIVPSSLGVLFLRRHPSQPINKITFNIHIPHSIFLLYIDQIIFKIYFFHLLVRTILTNISKSNPNYIIYVMHITMAVTCGVDICTSPQSAFQYNYISIFIILIDFPPLYINNKFFKKQFPLSAGQF